MASEEVPQRAAPTRPEIESRAPKRISDWLDGLGQPDWEGAEDRAYRKFRLGLKQLRRRRKFRDEILAEREAREHPERAMRPAEHAPEIFHTSPIPLATEGASAIPLATDRASAANQGTGDRTAAGDRVPLDSPLPADHAAQQTYPVSAATRLDAIRRWTVTVCLLVCILGSMIGVGVFGGTGIAEAAGGAFAPDATLLAPASQAFSIWSVIYLGLIAYTVNQWLPSQRTSKRHRNIGWLAAGSMILNCAWILSAQAGWVTVTVVVMALLLAVLIIILRQLNLYPSFSRLQTWSVDVPFGLYLGWIIVAAAGNAATWSTAAGWNLFDWGATMWSVIGLTAVILGGSVASATGKRGRLSVAVAISWGLFWVIVQRLWGEPTSGLVAFVAGLAMFAVFISAGAQRHRVAHAERLAVRRQWT